MNRSTTGGEQSSLGASPYDIAQHPVLSELSPEHQSEVLAHADVIRLRRQESLFMAGEPARHFFLCRSGQLRLFRLAPNGNEKIIGLVDPGSSFAEAAAFMRDASYPVSCQAVRDSELVRFDAAQLMALLRSEPESCIRLLGMLSARLHNRVADIESLSLQNAQLRVVNYLLRLYEQSGATIQLPTSKKHIAGLLAVQPETLSRVLGQLQDDQILRVERDQLEVLDGTRLVAVAEGRESL